MNISPFIMKVVKFGAVGVSGMAVDFGVTYISKEKAKFNKYVSNSLGFIAAVISNYVLNRIWTFESTNKEIALEFSLFLIFSTIGLGLNNLIIWLCHEKIWKFNFYFAKLVAIGIVFIWNFSINYLITFH